MKVYTKDHTRELMLAHYPVCQDVQYSRWYCKCGVYIDYLDLYVDHVNNVLRGTRGD